MIGPYHLKLGSSQIVYVHQMKNEAEVSDSINMIHHTMFDLLSLILSAG